jgi:dihydrofolate reductase
VSRTLTSLDWNAEVVRGDLRTAIEALKAAPGRRLLLGGVTLPLALATMGLIDEYLIVVHQRIAGHGPTLLAGLSPVVDLQLVHRHDFPSGAMALTYVPKR